METILSFQREQSEDSSKIEQLKVVVVGPPFVVNEVIESIRNTMVKINKGKVKSFSWQEK